MDKKGRLWSLRDLSTYLNVAERTVVRMIQKGQLPAVRVGNQWRAVPGEIEGWLEQQRKRPESMHDLLRSDPMAVPFDRLVHRDYVAVAEDLRSQSDVLKRLAGMVTKAYPEVDAGVYAQALEDREKLMSTAIGSGVAIPHIRRIEENPPDSLDFFLLVTTNDVSFGGSPCRIFCLVCTDDLVLHLRMNQKITYVLRRDDVTEDLGKQTDADGIIKTILRAERTMRYDES
jgi:PTS system nitrogen regulatory IIA component